MAVTPRVQLVQSVAAVGSSDRVGRYPKHTFNIESKPFTIQPIGIAPVLPGETFKSLFFESRVVTDPINNPLTGWKKDYFWFYVKATAVYGEAIRDMFIDLQGNVDLAATEGIAANTLRNYTAKGGLNYLELSLRVIAEAHFRDQDEAYNVVPLINNYPAAQIRETNWLNSLTDKDLVPEGVELDAAADTGDLERLMTAYEQLRSLGLANITYDEYLASFGIRVDADPTDDKPMLLHHVSDFQYPSNAVDPTDGSVSSAVSWVFRGGESKKRRFFKEPGFIVGVTVTRPKVFFVGLAGNMSAHLSRAWDWMPELLQDLSGSSLKKFEAGTGPLGDRTIDTDAYFVDMRDLFTEGDQFQNRVNFDPEMDHAQNKAINGVPLPDVNLNWKYPDLTIVNSFFKTVNVDYIREDGYFSLNIAGKQRDLTPGALTLTAAS